MVRLNQQTDFQLPFIVSDWSTLNQQLNPNHLNLADRVLSIFAATFFFAILLSITMDNPDSAKLTSTNSIATLKPQVEAIMPLANLEQKEIQINKNEKPQISENKILALVPSLKKETKAKVTQKVNTAFSNPIQKNSNVISHFENNEISHLKESSLKEEIHLNQPPVPSVVKNETLNSSAKITMVSPKPVFVNNKVDDRQLVINDKITQDLLPQSYFHAKEKAADEGKLMYIKFGAKWCLPCRQMEKTTFKDKKVKDFSNKNYVSLAVDVDDFDGINMKAYFNVKFLPTLLIFNSQGNFIAKYVNYQSAASMLEILEKHKSEHEVALVISSNEVISTPVLKIAKIGSVNFNDIILSKKSNGEVMNSLKSKVKNWKFAQLNFPTKNINKGELLLKVKETSTGINLTELNIPVVKKGGIADTPTTNFQLVLEHEKRKKKNGEYVVETYHLTQNDSMLVGKLHF
jgi:thioredoxin-related protein